MLSNPKALIRENISARWTALTTALKCLTAASKIPDAENLVKIHIARGDCEVNRFQLGQMEVPFETASNNSEVLLKNAGKMYVGAKNLAANYNWEEQVCDLDPKCAL